MPPSSRDFAGEWLHSACRREARGRHRGVPARQPGVILAVEYENCSLGCQVLWAAYMDRSSPLCGSDKAADIGHVRAVCVPSLKGRTISRMDRAAIGP